MSDVEDITLSIKSINVSPGDGGPHGIVVNGNGPVLINSITPGSAAAKADLKIYDFIIKINGNSVDSTGSDDVMAMLTSLRGLPITLMIARPTPTPTKPTQRRRAILKLQTRLDAEPNILPDDAVKARKEMGAAATSALSQLSSLDDILGIGPINPPPKKQVVPSRKDVNKETVNISMAQSSECTQEYEINFKETHGEELPPSSDEEDVPGQVYDPLLDFDNDDDMTIVQGSMSVKSNDNAAKLRRGPSASNRGMLDDMRDAQQALKQFTEFTRDKLDTIEKQKRAKEEEQRAKPTILSQHSVEIQPQKKQPQPTLPAASLVDNIALYSQVKKPTGNKTKKEDAIADQSVDNVVSTEKRVPSNDYDELERPHKPFYVNQPLVSSQPTSPTVSKPLESPPPPTVPSYNPPKRDSFPLSNRAEYISEMITERFGPGDLGGHEEDKEPVGEPYLAPSNSKPLKIASTTKSKPLQVTPGYQSVVQKLVEPKKVTAVGPKSNSSVQETRETSPPAINLQKQMSKEAVPSSKPVQRKSSNTRVSPDPKPVAKEKSSSSKPFTKATSPGAKSSSTSPTRSPEPPEALKGFSPMRPYEGMEPKEPAKGKERQGSLKKLFKSINPKTSDPVWQLADVNTACKGLPMQIHSWQNQHVLQWLNQLSEEVYSKSHSKFQQHAITGHTLLRLNEDQLKLMGISDSKLRHTLAGVIARLKVRQAQIEISGLMKGGDAKRPSRH